MEKNKNRGEILNKIKEEIKKRQGEWWLAELIDFIKWRIERNLYDAMFSNSFEEKEFYRGFHDALTLILQILEVNNGR